MRARELTLFLAQVLHQHLAHHWNLRIRGRWSGSLNVEVQWTRSRIKKVEFIRLRCQSVMFCVVGRLNGKSNRVHRFSVLSSQRQP